MKITPINGNCETEGVPYIYYGAKLIVARAGNTNFKKVFRETLNPYKDEFDAGRLSEEKSNEIMISCVAKTILVGWEGVKDEDGNDIPYSYENAVELLTDDQDCYDAITGHSNNIENYLTTAEQKLKGK